MRVTNKIMTTNALYNLNINKGALSRYETQVATGKKIQKPSEDPIIAVRALKLRTNLNKINQYLKKNVPDAKSWMKVTEDALSTINEVYTDIITKCDQGANGIYNTTDRAAIVTVFQQFKSEIMQKGSTDYAGRTVFTGYKTDKSLIFTQDEKNTTYEITQKLSYKDISTTSVVSPQITLDTIGTIPYDEHAKLLQPHTIQLGYRDVLEGLSDLQIMEPDPSDPTVLIEKEAIPITATMNSGDLGAYEPDPGDIIFIKDTGELVLGSDVYEKLKREENINFSYKKTGFKQDDLRPEFYFDCKNTTNAIDSTDIDNIIEYKKKDQPIEYEVSFNQMLPINVQGSTVFTHDIAKKIDSMMNNLNTLTKIEDKITDINKQISNADKTDTALVDKLNSMLAAAQKEKDLQGEICEKEFEQGITFFQKKQDNVNAVVSDLGVRQTRLELVETRLTSQKDIYEELKSVNEDANVDESIIQLKTAELIYNASLQATASTIRNSLLDFI